MEQIVNIYLSSGLTLQDLKENTMKDCNLVVRSKFISSYQEYMVQRANYVKPKNNKQF